MRKAILAITLLITTLVSCGPVDHYSAPVSNNDIFHSHVYHQPVIIHRSSPVIYHSYRTPVRRVSVFSSRSSYRSFRKR